MYILLTYDIAKDDNGPKRLRKISKLLEKYGSRVQYSVFECEITPADEKLLINKINKIIDDTQDTIRIYYLGNNYKSKIKTIGTNKGIDVNDVLLF
jgi:CRISPR-associated protein Cas2